MQRLRTVVSERREQSSSSTTRGAAPVQSTRKPDSRNGALQIPQPPHEHPMTIPEGKRQRPASGQVRLGGHRRVQVKPAVPLPSLSNSNNSGSRSSRVADSGRSAAVVPLKVPSSVHGMSGRGGSSDTAVSAPSATAHDVNHAAPSLLGFNRSRTSDQESFVSIVDDYSLLLKDDLEGSTCFPLPFASSVDDGTSGGRSVASQSQQLVSLVQLDSNGGLSALTTNSTSSPLRPTAPPRPQRMSSDVSFASASSSTRDVILESQHDSTCSLDALRSQYFDSSKSLDPTSSFFLLEIAGQVNVDPLDLMDRSYHRSRSMRNGGGSGRM